MKESAGEANMTVITIVLIGVVAAVGLLVLPTVIKHVKFRSCCNMAGGKISACPSTTNRCCWFKTEADRSAFITCNDVE